MSTAIDSQNNSSTKKPLLRGHFHQAAFFVAVGACFMLYDSTETKIQQFTTLVYSFCLLGLFGISALYHRPNWTSVWRSRMRKLDHSAIFLSIGGTATPICLLGIQGDEGVQALLWIWLMCTAGIAQSIFWVSAPKWISALLAVFAGWFIVPYLSKLAPALGATNLVLLFSGGIIYSLGAAVYAFKWPNPNPKVFGYHEVFHILVVIAAICHFAIVQDLVS